MCNIVQHWKRGSITVRNMGTGVRKRGEGEPPLGNRRMTLYITILFVVTAITFGAGVIYLNQGQGGNIQSQDPASHEDKNGSGEPASATVQYEADPPVFTNVSVHDPSIIKADGVYYIFGTHIEAARSEDLMSWTRFTNGYRTPGNALYGDLSANLAESFAWAGEDDADSKGGYAVWAPEIFWNEHYVHEDGTKGAYMLYYSVSSTYIRSAIGFAVSREIEGPYEYVDTIVYSGFTEHEAYDANSDVNKVWTNTNIPKLIESGQLSGVNEAWFTSNGAYNNRLYPNAIDANLFYDTDGRLWMSYGSWSGGIFLLEIDPVTGRAIYPGEDGETEDGRMIDRYFGTKIAGGYTKSGEGPYIVYDDETGYYYLYMTYGWLGADGGYNMRLFRSERPDGPYLDIQGQHAVLPGSVDNAPYGNKLMGNFIFERLPGDPGSGSGIGYASPGHNSVLIDQELGKRFLVFHTRFPNRGEMHEVRVHQLFMNKDGWPVAAPYRYAGETLEEIEEDWLVGSYKIINHGKDNLAVLKKPERIRFEADGTITGAASGTWQKTDRWYATITLNGVTYEGVYVWQWDPVTSNYVLAFTAVSDEGMTLWGSMVPERSDEEVAAAVEQELKLEQTVNVVADLTLPEVGSEGAVISWTSSNPEAVTDKGVVTRPPAGSEAAKATLTATIRKGDAVRTKSFEITVLPEIKVGLKAHYAFEGNLEDSTGQQAAGRPTGDRIDNTGGEITYAEGVIGQAAVFDGQSGVRLPNGLILGDEYTVSLWIQPKDLTLFTTTFFGARDSNNWVSIVPMGPAGDQTMVWSGSSRWYDAATGLTVDTDEWTHLAFSVEEGTVRVYVDGEEKFSGTDFPDIFTTSSASFSLGVNWWDPPYQGLIDELRIYDGVLSAEEIAELSAIQ